MDVLTLYLLGSLAILLAIGLLSLSPLWQPHVVAKDTGGLSLAMVIAAVFWPFVLLYFLYKLCRAWVTGQILSDR